MATRFMHSVDIQLFLNGNEIDTPFKHVGILEDETVSTLVHKINNKLTCLKNLKTATLEKVTHNEQNILMLGDSNINKRFDESTGTDFDCSDPDVFKVYLVSSTGGSRRKSRRNRKSRKSRR
jgi:hypothetical protein